MMMDQHSVELTEGAKSDLRQLSARHRALVIDAIKTHLMAAPDVETRHKKRLRGLVPPRSQLRPVWQLTVVPFRVFYDVDSPAKTVIVNAVRAKPPGKTAKEIL